MTRPPGLTYANGSPYRPLPYPKARLRGCADGAHGPARGTTDRTGALLWVCTAGTGDCRAYREAGDPQWRTP